jgi:hypothetical protein
MTGFWAWLSKVMKRKPVMRDVRVVGLVNGAHTILDLNIKVPYGVEVGIPAELALQSRDLWLGISQRQLFQLRPDARTPSFLRQPPSEDLVVEQERERLARQVAVLTSQLASLQEENSSLRSSLSTDMAAQTAKIDALLLALQNGALVPSTGTSPVRVAKEAEDVVDGAAPTFIPRQIKPEDVEVRIDIQAESSTAEISSAAERLRQLRKRKSD